MRYFLDTEFNGFGGELISLALIREDQESFYNVSDKLKQFDRYDPWVAENVIPILRECPIRPTFTSGPALAYLVAGFLGDDPAPEIIADWPDDIAYLCKALITAPGQMIRSADRITFTIERVDAYPTSLKLAVRHNAWWDAMALRRKIKESERDAA